MENPARPDDRIALPQEMPDSPMTLHETICQRRSIREYGRQSLTLGQVARLLHSTYGVTDLDNGLLAAPSAGATYPLEIYVVAHSVDQLAQGIYHYAPGDHSLLLRVAGDFRHELRERSLNQDIAAEAAIVVAFGTVFYRTSRRYGERANRYIPIDIGHAAENTCLSATALGLASCPLGAFLDEEVNDLFRVDGATEAIMYMIAVGPR